MEYFWNLEDDKVKDTEYRGKKDVYIYVIYIEY